VLEYRDTRQMTVDLRFVWLFPPQVDVADRTVVQPCHQQFASAGVLPGEPVGEVLVVTECRSEEFEIIRVRRPDRQVVHRPGEPSFKCHEALWWRSSRIHHRAFGARRPWVVKG
jgi:hypothetical protein